MPYESWNQAKRAVHNGKVKAGVTLGLYQVQEGRGHGLDMKQ